MRQAFSMILSLAVCAPALAAPPASTAPVDPLVGWARAKAPEALPDDAKGALEALVRKEADRPVAALTWARIVAVPAKGPALVLLAAETATAPAGDTRARREGLLALATIDAGGATLRDKQRIPLPGGMRWTFRPGSDVDGDRQNDTLAEWEEAGQGVKRSGLAIARTAPPGLTFIELGSDQQRAGRRHTARADVACFLPISGSKGQALVIQRQTQSGGPTEDGLQVLMPRDDGRYGDGRVYAAVFDFDAKVGEAKWRDVFSLRDPGAAQRQSDRGPCPAAGVLVRSHVLGGKRSESLSILGPLAASSSGVEQAVRRLPKAPRAVLVVALGE